ncbi:hypothetical protein [Psychromonas hadalis]|uniref:hypothetical protein n=1 Tax=Psychromonas hadalis TaxID=211669 RepID=UPI0003B45898|nr:hypothetical protein [Psychromonas hadalis]
MELIWLDKKEPSFENDERAILYSQTLLALISETETLFNENIPLPIETKDWLDHSGNPTYQAVSYTSGYLRGLELSIQARDPYGVIDDEDKAQLQQTCLLLLSKVAHYQTEDKTLQTLFSGLPEYKEIIAVLPKLLSQYGFNCAQY